MINSKAIITLCVFSSFFAGCDNVGKDKVKANEPNKTLREQPVTINEPNPNLSKGINYSETIPNTATNTCQQLGSMKDVLFWLDFEKLYAVDVSDKNKPFITSSLNLDTSGTKVCTSGDYLYVNGWKTIRIITYRPNEGLAIAHQYVSDFIISDFALKDNLLILTSSDGNIEIVDIKDPAHPILKFKDIDKRYAGNVIIAGESVLFIKDQEKKFQVFQILDSSFSLRQINEVEIPQFHIWPDRIILGSELLCMISNENIVAYKILGPQPTPPMAKWTGETVTHMAADRVAIESNGDVIAVFVPKAPYTGGGVIWLFQQNDIFKENIKENRIQFDTKKRGSTAYNDITKILLREKHLYILTTERNEEKSGGGLIVWERMLRVANISDIMNPVFLGKLKICESEETVD